MPVTLETESPRPSVVDLRERRLRRGSLRDRGKRIWIGLVNNMPDAALMATQRQFSSLLEDSAGEFDVRLSLWTTETLDRCEDTWREIAGLYRPAYDLRKTRQDAVIITGTEPRAPDLRDEPYWRELTSLFDWAEATTLSALFSCLAAHAAVQHWAGIARRRLPAKCSGVYATQIVARHELTEGFDANAATPHSRYNGLDEADLAAKGYFVLTRSPEAGVDIFVKEAKSLLVFMQGHPEYSADTLAREYRRDALRFLRGERPAPPSLPEHYFAPEVAARLGEFVNQAALAPEGDASGLFPTEAVAHDAAPWRPTSLQLFGNWLSSVARRKAADSEPSFARARWGG